MASTRHMLDVDKYTLEGSFNYSAVMDNVKEAQSYMWSSEAAES